MSVRRKKGMPSHIDYALLETTLEPMLHICSCTPVSPLCRRLIVEQEALSDDRVQAWENKDAVVPVSSSLNDSLRAHLHRLSSPPATSILLLHVAQLAHPDFTSEVSLHKRQSYHPTDSIVEQIMVNVRRAIRADDSVYLDADKGAALVLTGVDQQGAHKVLERVYESINLLQAETLIPALTHETDIVLGLGSYPEQGHSLEHVLAYAGCVLHRITLRPAISTRLWDAMPVAPVNVKPSFSSMLQEESDLYCASTPSAAHDHSNDADTSAAATVPFLRLPTVLPKRLLCLVSYTIASRYRCIPVGRDHSYLTVAMADPSDGSAISALEAATGMTIFPVSCDIGALDVLLDQQW